MFPRGFNKGLLFIRKGRGKRMVLLPPAEEEKPNAKKRTPRLRLQTKRTGKGCRALGRFHAKKARKKEDLCMAVEGRKCTGNRVVIFCRQDVECACRYRLGTRKQRSRVVSEGVGEGGVGGEHEVAQSAPAEHTHKRPRRVLKTGTGAG